MDFKKFVDIIVKRVKPEIVCFDSCYSGTISCLYELSPYTRYVVSSPAWHPYTSISELKAFGDLPKKSRDFKGYAVKLASQFNSIKSNPKYTCLIAFDISKLDSIVSKVRSLDYSNEYNLKLNEKDTYDFSKVVNSSISEKIKGLVISDKCMKNCPVSIEGPSIYYVSSSDQWRNLYLNSRWAKFIKHKKVKIIYPRQKS